MKLRTGLVVQRSLHPAFRRVRHACSIEDLCDIVNSPRFPRVQAMSFKEKIVPLCEFMLRERDNPGECVSCVVVGSELKCFLKGFIALGVPAFPIKGTCQRGIAADFKRVERNCPPGRLNRCIEKSFLSAKALLFKEEARQPQVT